MFVFISQEKQVKMLVFISWLVSFGWSLYSDAIFLWRVRNKLQTINIYLSCSKEDKKFKKRMSGERGLNFDQWKTFPENFRPMRAWLWLVYKFTENYCRLRLFSEFIQTQKRYPTSLDKIRILTWKLIVISC